MSDVLIGSIELLSSPNPLRGANDGLVGSLPPPVFRMRVYGRPLTARNVAKTPTLCSSCLRGCAPQSS